MKKISHYGSAVCVAALSVALLVGCGARLSMKDAVPVVDYAQATGSGEVQFTWMGVQFGVGIEGGVDTAAGPGVVSCVDVGGFVHCATFLTGDGGAAAEPGGEGADGSK